MHIFSPKGTWILSIAGMLHLFPMILVCLILCTLTQTKAQPYTYGQKVLTMRLEKYGNRKLSQDQGVAGAWQQLLKLQTTASILHTTAHPDDEHADLLTYLSRGKGVRTALLSLNRGESGANVLGSESFDALGVLRTEEMLLAGFYYGLDDLYFTDLVDYGYSKRVEEAYQKWDKQHVIEQMVRVVRINRPLVIISRFHGTARDGHGNHQAAGEISQLIWQLAADPKAFPDQITKEGLRPWKPLKVYRGGVRAEEPWNMALHLSEYSPWLGETYASFAATGYSMHRSQFGGIRPYTGSESFRYYELLHGNNHPQKKEQSPFDGLDTSLKGMYTLTGETPPAGGVQLLTDIEIAVKNALAQFRADNPAASIQPLTSALAIARKLIGLSEKTPETLFLLKIKEQQLMDVIHTILGIHIQLLAVPKDTPLKRNFYQPPPTLSSVVPGQQFGVEARLSHTGNVPLQLTDLQLLTPEGWQVKSAKNDFTAFAEKGRAEYQFEVQVAEKAPYSKPYFYRNSLQETHYQKENSQYVHLPYAPPLVLAKITYQVNNVAVEYYEPVVSLENNLPYGQNTQAVKVSPLLSLQLQPVAGILPIAGKNKTMPVTVHLQTHAESPLQGEVTLKVPSTWKVSPAQWPYSFTKAGEKTSFTFQVSADKLEKKEYSIGAVAKTQNVSYTSGYILIKHRDLDKNYLYREAVTQVKAIEVQVKPSLQIGYIMGAGDDVPQGIRQLGSTVQMLTETDLATVPLQKFEVIMIGTRAYAVRADLQTYHQRLLNFVKEGGHLIVLYQTPEFNPEKMAHVPAKLPPNAEEVSEEDAPVQILATGHAVLNSPNKITQADFEGWVEQRGSKFFSEWNKEYTAIIASNDVNQAPQAGGWLMAPYGKGHYTYFAYSLHRQLPYGVTGAYRILANLLSYGR